MSKLALVAARSPARAALAAAIAERDHIAATLRFHEGKYEAAALPYSTWERRDEIEHELGRASGNAGKNTEVFRRMERTAALLRGEDPAALADPVDPAVALRAELAEIDELITKSEEARRQISADVDALRDELRGASGAVRDAANAVMAAEAGRTALIAEYDQLAARAAILARAIDGAASPWTLGQPKPHYDLHAARNTALAAAPCPWAAAAERLTTDPDAQIPTVEAALAAVGARPSNLDAA